METTAALETYTRREYMVREVGTNDLYGPNWDDQGEAVAERDDCARAWPDRKFEVVSRVVTIGPWVAPEDA